MCGGVLMKALKYAERITERVQELRTLCRHQQRSLTRRRLQFLILLKSGKCGTQAKAGALIGIGARASEKLWKLYVTQGIAGLLPPRTQAAHPNSVRRQK